MKVLTRLLILAAISVGLSSGAKLGHVTPPAERGRPYTSHPGHDTNIPGSLTDSRTIMSTAHLVEQKDGPKADSIPALPITETTVTAVDGELLEAEPPSFTSTSDVTSERRLLKKRAPSDYNLIFTGTGTGAADRDASIEGTAYLTFRLVDNSTYNVEACLDFCSSEPKCVFANLYYELNNELLDAESSNLKCAIYGDVHTAKEKTNLGGQSSYRGPGDPLTYIQHSGGWASREIVEPDAPEGYELVFGPTNGANNAPGYMGFAFLDKYDVDACARECNHRGADRIGGACQYFNIWRAVVSGIPTTYTCSMYFLPADASTAVNTGQGDLQVTFSRGYRRINYIIDGGFEAYNECDDFCFTEQYANWIASSPPGGHLDATIFYWQPYTHTGNAAALLGSADASDDMPGMIRSAHALDTIPGRMYQVAFFQNSGYSLPAYQELSIIEVIWNGRVIKSIRPGFCDWTFHSIDVKAVGSDVLEFRGGSAPAWTFLDDIAIWPMLQ